MNNSDEIYRQWYAVYHELATLPIDSEEVRHSSEILAKLRGLGWSTSAQVFDAYWNRVNWTANHCTGRVLEVGSGMGNVTRWIANNPAVESVLALDPQPEYIETLRGFCLPKTTAHCADVCSSTNQLKRTAPFDTVVLAEFIEHITFREELAIIDTIRPYLSPKAVWVVSTPIGFMPDPDHKRGFPPSLFRWHLRLLYGPILARSDNGIQHYVKCKDMGFSGTAASRARTMLAMLGHLIGSTSAVSVVRSLWKVVC